MKKSALVLAVAYALTLVACQTLPYEPYARAVKVQPKHGGVIAMRTNYRPEDKQKAMAMMADNCGAKKPEVTEEGEVVTGQTTTTDANNYYHNNNNAGSIFLSPTSSTSTQSSTTQQKEWQMTYKCM